MASEAELLRAVLASPDADGPRLEYAGWCEGQGEAGLKARGAFIRWQVELARPGVVHERAHVLRYDTSKALERWEATWDREVGVLTSGREYDRGFVELVRLTARDFMARAKELRALAPIRHVDLTEAKGLIGELAGSGVLAGLRSLSLAGNGLDDDEVARLAESDSVSGLRWLDLATNRLTSAAAWAMARSAHLKGLRFADFRENPVNPAQGYSFDGDLAIPMDMPKQGKAIEAHHGPQAWLRREETRALEVVPSRFRM